MKYTNLYFLVFLLIFSCKKETNTLNQKANLPTDSVVSADQNTPTFSPLNEKSSPGKVIFTQNGKAILSFDTRVNTGKIIINEKEYPLDHLLFSENEYEISGKNIEIHAADGDFDESATECIEGTFTKISVSVEGKQMQFLNIASKDCPAEN